MGNQMFVTFQKVANFNVKGECVSTYWCVNIKDDFINHSFFYEGFDQILEDWKEEQVIESMKQFEILDEFIESLEIQKGFYYPSKTNVSSWVKIETSQLLEEVQN